MVFEEERGGEVDEEHGETEARGEFELDLATTWTDPETEPGDVLHRLLVASLDVDRSLDMFMSRLWTNDA